MKSKRYPRIEMQPIADLRPHPRQAIYFLAPSEHEVKELAADMHTNGQLTPIEILPDNTIIAGHKRTEAARLLGWSEVRVWVREDLAHDSVAVERRMIEDNLYRRQLGLIALGRCYLRLKHLERQYQGGRLSAQEQGDLRDRLGRRLGKSGRTLDRLLRIIECTPLEVQDAVERGKLPMTLALQVASLGNHQRDELAQAIHAGEDVKTVVTRYLKQAPRRRRTAMTLAERLLKHLSAAVHELGPRVGEIHTITSGGQQTLQASKQLIADLLRRAAQLKRKGS
jgi:ParB/RepB/Spo0J family partition protein